MCECETLNLPQLKVQADDAPNQVHEVNAE